MKKSLCICAGGRVRSVAARFILTDYYDHDAIACGVDKNSVGTVAMLCEWADNIFVLDATLLPKISDQFSKKIIVIDVGSDRWGTEKNTELRELVRSKLNSVLGPDKFRQFDRDY